MMTTDKEITPEFRDEVGTRKKDKIIWSLGEAAVTEMTKTVKDGNHVNVKCFLGYCTSSPAEYSLSLRTVVKFI